MAIKTALKICQTLIAASWADRMMCCLNDASVSWSDLPLHFQLNDLIHDRFRLAFNALQAFDGLSFDVLGLS